MKGLVAKRPPVCWRRGAPESGPEGLAADGAGAAPLDIWSKLAIIGSCTSSYMRPASRARKEPLETEGAFFSRTRRKGIGGKERCRSEERGPGVCQDGAR